jgi:hypothetical protein
MGHVAEALARDVKSATLAGQLLEQVAKGEMPEGMSESDLRAMFAAARRDRAVRGTGWNYLVSQSRSDAQGQAERIRL